MPTGKLPRVIGYNLQYSSTHFGGVVVISGLLTKHNADQKLSSSFLLNFINIKSSFYVVMF